MDLLDPAFDDDAVVPQRRRLSAEQRRAEMARRKAELLAECAYSDECDERLSSSAACMITFAREVYSLSADQACESREQVQRAPRTGWRTAMFGGRWNVLRAPSPRFYCTFHDPRRPRATATR